MFIWPICWVIPATDGWAATCDLIKMKGSKGIRTDRTKEIWQTRSQQIFSFKRVSTETDVVSNTREKFCVLGGQGFRIVTNIVTTVLVKWTKRRKKKNRWKWSYLFFLGWIKTSLPYFLSVNSCKEQRSSPIWEKLERTVVNNSHTKSQEPSSS